MKKSGFFLFFVILMLFICGSCSEKAVKSSKVKVQTIDGVPHVYNPAEPIKGIITLELEKVFEIDSLKINPDKPPHFDQFRRSKDRIYIVDSPGFKVYVFDKGGKLLKELSVKGQGPGEFDKIYGFTLETTDDGLWLPGMEKIARFNQDGNLIEDIKFNQRRYRNIHIQDENRFIGKYFYHYQDEEKGPIKQKSVSLMFDRQENELVKYLEDSEAGGIVASGTLPNGEVMRVLFNVPSIAPDILHRVDRQRNIIYITQTKYYKIFVKTLEGKTLRVIHRKHENKMLSEDDRKAVVDRVLFHHPPHIKKLMRENLPKRFCAIFALVTLPNGYLSVFRLIGPRLYEIDIFDPEGQYVYQLKFPENLIYRAVSFYGDRNLMSLIASSDDRDVCREYRIKNLPEIYGN